MADANLVVPYQATLDTLDASIATWSGSAYLGLFVSDTTIGVDTILADLTEATFDGYAKIALDGWSDAILDVGNNASTT